jgi:hypothetical protein
MSEALYRKVGRRYVPAYSSIEWDRDCMPVGTFRLVFASGDGSQRYSHGVTPETASWAAAADIARHAIESAISEAVHAKPMDNKPRPYTKRQAEILARYRAEMREAGGLLPEWWQHTSARELADAAVDAVRHWGDTK